MISIIFYFQGISLQLSCLIGGLSFTNQVSFKQASLYQPKTVGYTNLLLHFVFIISQLEIWFDLA